MPSHMGKSFHGPRSFGVMALSDDVRLYCELPST